MGVIARRADRGRDDSVEVISPSAEVVRTHAGQSGKESLMTTTIHRSVDLVAGSATELLAALRARTISSRELLGEQLSRIAAVNPALNAVVTLDADAARGAAARADEETARGVDVGALHGLPMTIKDSLETAGLRTTAGAPELASYVP